MSQHESPLAGENRAFALDIIARIEANTGMSLRSLFEGDRSAAEIRKQVFEQVVNYIDSRQENEAPDAEWPLAGQRLDARQLLLAATGSTINVTPNIAVTEYNYNILKGYRGRAIHEYVKGVTNGLALLNDKMTAGEAAATIIGSGIAAFAAAMIVATAKALYQKVAFRAAVVMGVKAMGKMSVVVGVAVLIVTELLLYLMIQNKKVFLGMVYNNSNLSLVVRDWRKGTDGSNSGDLFMSTGSMTTFMLTHMTERLDSPEVQVKSKLDVGDPADNLIMAGIFCAEKNFGFNGTEGAMVLGNYSATPGPSWPRFAFVFACPYVQNNGVNAQIDTAAPEVSAKSYFDQLYNSRGQSVTKTSGDYTFSAYCADERGGEAVAIAMLDKKV